MVAQGLDLKHLGLVHAGYEFAARKLPIGFALGMVALNGVPESIAIVTSIRTMVEVQTIALTLIGGTMDMALAMPLALLVAEVVIIKASVGAVQARDIATS